MIDRIMKILEEMPLEKRKATLKMANIITWVIFFISFVIELPLSWCIIQLVLCLLLLAIELKLINMGGWLDE